VSFIDHRCRGFPVLLPKPQDRAKPPKFGRFPLTLTPELAAREGIWGLFRFAFHSPPA
jgi:hypothetical protein